MEGFLAERADHLGGLIQTEQTGGFVVEAGPDSFLSEKPEAIALAKELRLESSFLGSNDAQRRTYILHHGRLVPLPEGMMLFAPARLGPALGSPLLPFSTKLSILREAFFPRPASRRDPESDESVAQFVRRRFGSRMLENIAEPLVAGIYGGDAEKLSARALLPSFYRWEEQYGSVIRGVWKSRKKAQFSTPVFTSLREGMTRLTRALSGHLSACNDFRLYTNQAVESIRVCSLGSSQDSGPGSRPAYVIQCAGGGSYEANAVILALPAFECARLLSPLNSELGSLLSSIPYTSALTVALGHKIAPPHLPPGFGFLVPPCAGHSLLACTFAHTKFDFRAPPGSALLRCFLGGAHNPNIQTVSDEELMRMVLNEVRAILGIKATPDFYRIYRWPNAMPQYVVGHLERVRKIGQEIEKLPGIFLAGNAYSGVGISDCIRTANSAAAEILRLANAWE